jgi:hypothetical protein
LPTLRLKSANYLNRHSQLLTFNTSYEQDPVKIFRLLRPSRNHQAPLEGIFFPFFLMILLFI